MRTALHLHLGVAICDPHNHKHLLCIKVTLPLPLFFCSGPEAMVVEWKMKVGARNFGKYHSKLNCHKKKDELAKLANQLSGAPSSKCLGRTTTLRGCATECMGVVRVVPRLERCSMLLWLLVLEDSTPLQIDKKLHDFVTAAPGMVSDSDKWNVSTRKKKAVMWTRT